MHTAVCYLRVSTQEQAIHGVSLEAQNERLQAYCVLQELEIVKVLREEGVSASKPLEARPQGKEMIGLLARKGVGHIVAMKLDRLFRNAEDALYHTRHWDNQGLTLHLVDMGGQSLNTSSAMGRMMLTMMAAFAEFERNLISERTVAAMQHKKKHLQHYAQVPYGFEAQDSMLVQSHAEQGVIVEMRAWRSKGLTFRAIANRLNRDRIPTKNGGTWHAATVRQILANEIHS